MTRGPSQDRRRDANDESRATPPPSFPMTNPPLRFVSAQPDTPWFAWQTEVYLRNFLDLGIAADRVTALFAVERAETTTPELTRLQRRFPAVDIQVFTDERNARGRSYEPSIQPHLIERWLRTCPEAIEEPVFFHDSDVALRWLPDFDALQRHHPGACLLSDSDRYIGYDYLHDVCEKIRAERPELAEDDLLDRMCAVVGIDRATVRRHRGASGGAQYLLCGLGPDHWAKVYADSLALRELFNTYVDEHRLAHEAGHYLQVWTAGMWAYLWNLWAAGRETVVHPDLDFLFGVEDLDETSPILHMAGKTGPGQPGRFDKTDWHGLDPIEAVRVQPYVFDHHDPGSVAEAYGNAIRNAAGVPDPGRCPLTPARHWRLLSWGADRHELWDVEHLHLSFEEETTVIDRFSSGSAGPGFDVAHAFVDDDRFWGGRPHRPEGGRPELYLGVELDRPATPTAITLTHASLQHRSHLVVLQRSDDGTRWCSVRCVALTDDDRTQVVLYRSREPTAAPSWRLVADETAHGFAWDVSRLDLLVDDRPQTCTLSASGDAGPAFDVDRLTRGDGAWGGRRDGEGLLHLTASDPAGLALDRVVLEQGPDHWASSITVQRASGEGTWEPLRHFDDLAPGRNDLLLHDRPPMRKRPRPVRARPDPSPAGPTSPDPFADRRILVTIASYRDPEVAETVASAITRAAYPEHLRFAICHQFDEETRHALDRWGDDPRMVIDAVPYEESLGCCWARHRTFGHFDDEPYLLQIDAHTRFAARWDVRFIEMLESTGSDLPLLTTYPPKFTISADGAVEYDLEAGVQSLYVDEVSDDLITRQKTEMVRDCSAPGPSPTIAAGQIFTRGRFCRDVPYDPHLYFGGEEISLAARAHTSGYDLFHPNENLLWHLYDHDQPKHWDDHHRSEDHQRRTTERLRTLFQGDRRELGPYGLGSARTLASFERHAGIRLRPRPASDTTSLPIEIDQSVVEARDDYDAFVVVFLDGHGEEVARREVRDPTVLDRSRAVVTLHDLGTVLDSAIDYLVVPTRRDGAIGGVTLRRI